MATVRPPARRWRRRSEDSRAWVGWRVRSAGFFVAVVGHRARHVSGSRRGRGCDRSVDAAAADPILVIEVRGRSEADRIGSLVRLRGDWSGGGVSRLLRSRQPAFPLGSAGSGGRSRMECRHGESSSCLLVVTPGSLRNSGRHAGIRWGSNVILGAPGSARRFRTARVISAGAEEW